MVISPLGGKAGSALIGKRSDNSHPALASKKRCSSEKRVKRLSMLPDGKLRLRGAHLSSTSVESVHIHFSQGIKYLAIVLNFIDSISVTKQSEFAPFQLLGDTILE